MLIRLILKRATRDSMVIECIKNISYSLPEGIVYSPYFIYFLLCYTVNILKIVQQNVLGKF